MKKPQSLSLQEQLLKSGLTSDAKIKQVKSEKRKQTKQQRNNGLEVVNEVKIDLEQARLQQIERDKELNQLKKQADDQKALIAQVRQLIELNRMQQDAEGIVYHFNHDNKVKALYLPKNVRDAVVMGRAGIVKLEDSYDIVPAEIIEKIKERSEAFIIVFNPPQESAFSNDDPYAAFTIPDDLIW